MTIKLPDELRQAVTQPTPPRLVDEQTNTAYVLIREDLYERVKALLQGDDFDVDEAYPLLADLAPEDWEDASSYDSPRP
jgi:hypothetical protein